jgi:hypothetical protein
MAMTSLSKLLPKPARPEGTSGEFGWAEVERIMGHGLPADYKDFIEAYGAGCLGGFLWVLSPFTDQPDAQIVRQALARLEHLVFLGNDSKYAMRTTDPVITLPLEKDAERRAQLAKYPPRGQKWIAWAVLGNGGALYWLASGSGNRWKVVHLGPPGEEDGACPMPVALGASMTTVLMALLQRKTRLPGAPVGFPGSPPSYEPISEAKPPKWRAPMPVAVQMDTVAVVKLKKRRR